MTVSYLGAIRTSTSVRQEPVSDPTVLRMLETLMDRYGKPWRDRVFDGSGLRPDVVVMVNGLNIQEIRGLSTPLGLGDRVDIFPMFEGG